MSQHTPGPWRITGYPSGNKGWFGIIADVAKVHICDLFPFNNRAGLIKVDLEEHRANARLIAASPDLLEALKAVVAIADRRTDEFDAARAAIAKATTP